MSNRYDNSRVKGFLHARGRLTVNGDGEEILLRGWGAGNWTNPEGFMVGLGTGYMGSSMNPGLSLPGRFTSARSMNQVVRDLCGSKYAEEFWPRWHRAHLAEADIKAMAEGGYNSVRLPITSWVLLEEEPGLIFSEKGFSMLDQVLEWCEKYRIYAIIDLHGAPGGQSGLACDDGLDNIPHMFLEPESRERTICLWEEIAKRYADREIVGGYDLLNEPISISRWSYLKPELAGFYDDLIRRIRVFDRNHIVFLEGTLFSTNMDIFDHDYDPECGNWGISVHIYGASPEARELYKYLDTSLRLDIPVWIGEGRVKDPDMAVFYEIAAMYHMGFNLWAWKSVDNNEDTGRVSYTLPDGFDAVLKYSQEGGPRPSYQESRALFDALLDSILLENCTVNEKADLYCQRRQGITLPAAGYDPSPESFHGSWQYGNAFAFRAEDRTHLVVKDGLNVPDAFSPDGPPPARDPLGSLVLQLKEGDYVSYTVRFIESRCPVTVRVRSENGAVLRAIEGQEARELHIPEGNDWCDLEAAVFTPADERTVRLEGAAGILQIESVTFGR